MLGGYMGKLLFVDLSTGKMTEEIPDEKLWPPEKMPRVGPGGPPPR